MKDLYSGDKAAYSEEEAVRLLGGATHAGGVSNGLEVYDIDWNGKKVEVKMSTTYPIWTWNVSDKQAKVVDYIFLMGYDQEGVLLRTFLIPREAFKERDSYRGLGFRINDKSKQSSQYDQYEVVLKGVYKQV